MLNVTVRNGCHFTKNLYNLSMNAAGNGVEEGKGVRQQNLWVFFSINTYHRLYDVYRLNVYYSTVIVHLGNVLIVRLNLNRRGLICKGAIVFKNGEACQRSGKNDNVSVCSIGPFDNFYDNVGNVYATMTL